MCANVCFSLFGFVQFERLVQTNSFEVLDLNICLIVFFVFSLSFPPPFPFSSEFVTNGCFEKG